MTTFSYLRDIPDGPNNPSDDQPNMKINTNSIDDLIAIDHTSFNVLNGGQHKSITFNQDVSYVPIPPVSPPQLFTNIVGSLPQLFYYSGNATESANQYSVASNFSTFVLGGIILKGGTFTTSAIPGTSTIVTYSTLAPALEPFINDTLAVFLTPINSSAAGVTPRISSKNSTSFTVNYSNSASLQFYFLAIGY